MADIANRRYDIHVLLQAWDLIQSRVLRGLSQINVVLLVPQYHRAKHVGDGPLASHHKG